MARRKAQQDRSEKRQEQPATLGDLLAEDIREKLKAQAKELKQEQKLKQEAERKQKEEAKREEQKKLENNFEYLLNHSSQDWRKYK